MATEIQKTRNSASVLKGVDRKIKLCDGTFQTFLYVFTFIQSTTMVESALKYMTMVN